MSILNPKFKFENFIVYKGNKMAKAALETLLQNPLVFNPVFIYSETGMGKTHLISGFIHKLKEKNMPYIFIIPKEIEINLERMKKFEKGFIILDDFEEFTRLKKEIIEEFIENFEDFIANENQLIFSSSLPYTSFKELPEDFISRIKGGLIIEILKPDEEDKKLIIKRKAEIKGIKLEERYINLLARKDYKNIREIEGDLNRLLLRKITKGEIDDEDIEEVTGISLPVLFFSDILPEIEKSLERLEAIAQEEESLKTSLKEKIYIWEMKGFKTDRLKTLLAEKDIEKIKTEYNKFIKDVNRLIELQKIYGKIQEQDPYIEECLFDPDKLEEVEKWIESKGLKISEFEEEKIKKEEPIPEAIAEEVEEVREGEEVEIIEVPEYEVEEEAEGKKTEVFPEHREEVAVEEITEEKIEEEKVPGIFIIESDYNKEALELIRKQAKEGKPQSLIIFSPGHRGLSTHLLYSYEISVFKKKIFYHSSDISDYFFSDKDLSSIFNDFEFIIIDDAEILIDVEDLDDKIVPLIIENIEKGKKFLIGVRKDLEGLVLKGNFKKLYDISEKVLLKKPDRNIVEKIIENESKEKGFKIENEAKEEILKRSFNDLSEIFSLLNNISTGPDKVIKVKDLPWIKEKEEVEVEEKEFEPEPALPIEEEEGEVMFEMEAVEERVFEDYP